MATRAHNPRGWKFLIIVVLLVIGFTILGRGASMPEAFAKAQAMDQAEARSRDTGMPVLIFAAADSCDASEAMKGGALASRDASMWISQNTHPVVLDLSAGAPRSKETDRFNLRSTPTMVIVRGGREVARLEGQVRRERLMSWLAENSGPIADWRHANPGRDLPDIQATAMALRRPAGNIPVRGESPATPSATPER